MSQRCFASISDTGLHCAYCVTRNVIEDGVEMTQAYCNKHNRPCIELNYYCSSFIGYRPDWRLSDDEEQEMIDELIRKSEK